MIICDYLNIQTLFESNIYFLSQPTNLIAFIKDFKSGITINTISQTLINPHVCIYVHDYCTNCKQVYCFYE